eukprot:jgi/Ulvmu1/11472/UM077_0016.1
MSAPNMQMAMREATTATDSSCVPPESTLQDVYKQHKRTPHDQSLFVVGAGNAHLDAPVSMPFKSLKKTTGMKHNSGVSFNIFTCQYIDSDGGRRLAIRDDAVMARASLRTGRMYQLSHSVKHDIITGEDLLRPSTVSEQFQVRAPWEKTTGHCSA